MNFDGSLYVTAPVRILVTKRLVLCAVPVGKTKGLGVDTLNPMTMVTVKSGLSRQ